MPQLISASDYENLPEDDEECFLALERICRRNFDRLFDSLHNSEPAEPLWESYVSIVSSAAAQCGITDLTVPNLADSLQRFTRFQAKVDAVITRLHLQSRRRIGPHSVRLAPNTRTKIEHHVTLLRAAVESSPFPEWRKQRLLEKLNELLAELDNRRFKLGTAMAALGALLVGTTTVAADGPEGFSNITAGVTSIMKLISKDKEREDAEVRRMTPPARALPNSPLVEPDLDDDLPF